MEWIAIDGARVVKSSDTGRVGIMTGNGEVEVVGGGGGGGTVDAYTKAQTDNLLKQKVDKEDGKGLFSGSYNDLSDAPTIPTKTSELQNDSGYLTEHQDLTNYATKAYVGEQIANADHLKREIVTVIPSDTEAKDNIIYMLKVESATGNDKYQEYMKIDGTVQMIGDTSVDLTDYAKKTDIPTTLPANGGNAATVNNHTVKIDVPENAVFTDTIYDDTEVKGSIEELSSNLDTLEFGEVAGGKNLIDKNAIKYGYELVGSGGFNSNSDWYVTDYVQVKPNTTYTMSGMSSNFCSEYDANKNFVNGGNKNTFTTNSNTKYVVLNSLIDGYSTPQLEIGTTATPYEPYIPSVKMLAEEVEAQNESLGALGKCKNLLNPMLETTTINGVTCTNNGDGTYTLNGTASANAFFNISGVIDDKNIINKYEGSKLVGAPSGSSQESFYLYAQFDGGRLTQKSYVDFGNGIKLNNIKGYETLEIVICVKSEKTVSNLTFKPMLTTDLSATYDDFVPYTGDGDTLTHDVAEIKNTLVASNAGAHNCVYRGKYLGNALTTEQKAQISAGTFNDLYIGDYWTIGGVNYRIAAFDYWLNSGDTQCTKHHVVIVPDTCLYNAKMNTTSVTTGAYIGSEMYTTNLEQAKTIINDAFGSANILSHREYLPNATKATTDPTYESTGSWYDSTVELMNERMVYGADVFHNIEVNGAIPMNYIIDKSQLPLFALEPSRICNRKTWWLRDVVSAEYFADVNSYGFAGCYDASSTFGVRPAFGITGDAASYNTSTSDDVSTTFGVTA